MLIALLLIGAPASAQPTSGCAIPPEPDRPGSGLVGMLDPTAGAGAPNSIYGDVGYAGMTWHTYDICSRPDANTANTDTWVGSMLFNAAKTIVAAANGLHAQLSAPDQLDGLDNLLHDGVGAMYRATFTTWVGPALLILALTLLLLAARGDLAKQAKRAGVAIIALGLGAAVYAAPISLLKASDAVLLDGVSRMQQGFLAELKVGDHNTLPDTLTSVIVYANWQRGEFGSTDTVQARDLSAPLLHAQTFTRAEVAAGQDDAAAAARKKQDFQALTAKMGDRYAQFQGIAGSRVGTGGIALLQAFVLAAFPAAAKLIVFTAVIILRLLVLFGPLIAVIALMWPQVLPALFRLIAGVTVNAVLAGALAAAHAWLVIAMLHPGSNVNSILTLVVASIASALFWILIRPVRRLITLGSMILPRAGLQLPLAQAGVAATESPSVGPHRTPLVSPSRPDGASTHRSSLATGGLGRPALAPAGRGRDSAGSDSFEHLVQPSRRPEWSNDDDVETTTPQRVVRSDAEPVGASHAPPRTVGYRTDTRVAPWRDMGDRRART